MSTVVKFIFNKMGGSKDFHILIQFLMMNPMGI